MLILYIAYYYGVPLILGCVFVYGIVRALLRGNLNEPGVWFPISDRKAELQALLFSLVMLSLFAYAHLSTGWFPLARQFIFVGERPSNAHLAFDSRPPGWRTVTLATWGYDERGFYYSSPMFFEPPILVPWDYVKDCEELWWGGGRYEITLFLRNESEFTLPDPQRIIASYCPHVIRKN